MGGAAGASDRLRSQVHRMDGYMQQQRSQHKTRKDVPPESHNEKQHYNILPFNQPAGSHTQHFQESAMLGPHANPHNGFNYHFSANNSAPQQVVPHHHHQQQQQQQQAPPPEAFYSFPAEVFEDWNWAFDFTQTTR